MSDIALKSCRDYTYPHLKKTIKQALDLLGGLGKFIKPKQKVLLKPNLISDIAVNTNAATNPSFIRAVAELVLEEGATPIIGELATGYGNNKKVLISHVGKISKDLGIKMTDFESGFFSPVKTKKRLLLDKVYYANNYINADVRINLPKFKTHMHTAITGAVKNSFGCIEHKQRLKIHKDYQKENFSKAVVDVSANANFNLTIMDAIECLEGNDGPLHGPSANLGYIISGKDETSIDSVASKIANMDPLVIPTCRIAYENGIGEARIPHINLLGDPLIEKSFEKNFTYWFFKKMYESGEAFDDNYRWITMACTNCLICKNNCPVNAIHANDKRNNMQFIDTEKCIKCDCCIEMCPENAIIVKYKDK